MPSSFFVDAEEAVQAFSLGRLTQDGPDRRLGAILTDEPPERPEPYSEASDASIPSVYYEVQEDEGLLGISELLGVTRNRIISANTGMRERSPLVRPGDVILVPVVPDMTAEELEAMRPCRHSGRVITGRVPDLVEPRSS